MTREAPPIDSVPVARKFLDIFPADLPCLPLERDIGFAVDLEPGIKPIFVPSHCMALAELREFSV